MPGVPLVVVGASAGGIEALLDVVAGLPSDLGAAVLVTVHTGARPETALPRILTRAGPLDAAQAAGGERVRAGHILVAPPDRHLVLTRAGTVAVSAGPRVDRHRPAVDVLFGSAARTHGRRVVAAVLSGTLDDGAVGAALVARAGGRVVVQDPADARFDGMPRAARAAVPGADVSTARTLGTRLAEVVADMPREDERPAAGPTSGRTMGDSADPPFLFPDESAATRMTCPECNGALGRIDLPHVSYFRCHVGHRYGPRSLEAAQREAAEAALWAAVAALEEHATLAHHLAEDAPPDAAEQDADQDADGRADYRAGADRSASLARDLRECLTGCAEPAHPEDLPG